MRAIRAAAAALLGVAALTLTAPTAAASGNTDITPFGFSITPSTVPAGGRVTLSLTGCGTPATVSSGIFDTVTVPSGGATTTTVDREARPGATHRVTFTCGGMSGRTDLTIARAASPGPADSATAVPSPSGVRGGLGGSIGGVSTLELVAGTALVVAAATGTIFVARRRTEGRRRH